MKATELTSQLRKLESKVALRKSKGRKHKDQTENTELENRIDK